jgi:hypothetical protein
VERARRPRKAVVIILKSPFGSLAPIAPRCATKWREQHYTEMSTALIFGNQLPGCHCELDGSQGQE